MLQKFWKLILGEKERFLVGGIFGLVAFALSFVFLLNKDLFFDRAWFEGEGSFIEMDDAGWRAKAEKYVQEAQPERGICVSEWLGRDQKYLYLAIGCGKFQQNLGEISVEGQQNFYPTRIEFEGETLAQIDQVETTKDNGAVRSLFPKRAFDMYRWKSHRDRFLKMGWEKTTSLSNTSGS